MRARKSAYASDRDPSSRNITRLPAVPTNRCGDRLVSPTAPGARAVSATLGKPGGHVHCTCPGGFVEDRRRKFYDNGVAMRRDAPADPRGPAGAASPTRRWARRRSRHDGCNPRVLVRAQQPHVSAAVLATTPIEAGARRERSHPALRLPGNPTADPDDARRLTSLADLVDEVVACLDQPHPDDAPV